MACRISMGSKIAFAIIGLPSITKLYEVGIVLMKSN